MQKCKFYHDVQPPTPVCEYYHTQSEHKIVGLRASGGPRNKQNQECPSGVTCIFRAYGVCDSLLHSAADRGGVSLCQYGVTCRIPLDKHPVTSIHIDPEAAVLKQRAEKRRNAAEKRGSSPAPKTESPRSKDDSAPGSTTTTMSAKRLDAPMVALKDDQIVACNDTRCPVCVTPTGALSGTFCVNAQTIADRVQPGDQFNPWPVGVVVNRKIGSMMGPAVTPSISSILGSSTLTPSTVLTPPVRTPAVTSAPHSSIYANPYDAYINSYLDSFRNVLALPSTADATAIVTTIAQLKAEVEQLRVANRDWAAYASSLKSEKDTEVAAYAAALGSSEANVTALTDAVKDRNTAIGKIKLDVINRERIVETYRDGMIAALEKLNHSTKDAEDIATQWELGKITTIPTVAPPAPPAPAVIVVPKVTTPIPTVLTPPTSTKPGSSTVPPKITPVTIAPAP